MTKNSPLWHTTNFSATHICVQFWVMLQNSLLSVWYILNVCAGK